MKFLKFFTLGGTSTVEHKYNPFNVYCRELAPGTVSLTGDRAQGDDSKHDSHYNTQQRSKTEPTKFEQKQQLKINRRRSAFNPRCKDIPIP